ncbi:MAG: carbohydrate porin [Acidobacteria bacterium]|nr:carbohydrate porin [Acidobacteriota bacterium]
MKFHRWSGERFYHLLCVCLLVLTASASLWSGETSTRDAAGCDKVLASSACGEAPHEPCEVPPCLLLTAGLRRDELWPQLEPLIPSLTLSAVPGQMKPTANKSLWSGTSYLLHSLNDHGISFQGTFVNDWSKDLRGKVDPSLGYGRQSFDLVSSIDGKKAFGWNGSTVLIRLKQHSREFGRSDDGAAQVYSNIDAPSKTMLYEFWLEQKLWSEKLRIKGGKIDANTEFATVQSAGDFLNSSMGFSPTIMAFPTYPSPRLAVLAVLHPTTSGSVGFGVFQTDGKGRLSVLEPGKTWTISGKKELPGRVSVGYWRLDATAIPHFDGRAAGSTQGYYAVLEQALWRNSLSARKEQRWSMFFQFGQADGQVSQLTKHVGGGATLQAPLARRSQDSLGFAFTRVAFTSAPGTGNFTSELVLEGYYKVAIAKHVALVQDFQFLHHPGGLSSNPDCPILTPRLVVSF